MIRQLTISIITIFSLLLLATPAFAQSKKSPPKMSAGVAIGYNFDAEAPLLGLDGRFTVYEMDSVAFSINPRFDYFFISSTKFLGLTTRTTFFQIEANALAHLLLDIPLTPYAGVGASMLYHRTSISDSRGNRSSNDGKAFPGFNIVAGTTFDLDGPISPFAQFRLTFWEGHNSASLMVGANFKL